MLINSQNSLVQGCSLGIPCLGLMEYSQVVEAWANMRMLGAEALLIDGQGSLVQEFSLAVAPLTAVDVRQVVEANGNDGVRGPEGLLANGEGALVETFSLTAFAFPILTSPPAGPQSAQSPH